MAEATAISWTDATFNPWVGCTKVSPACDRCYAEGWAKRTGSPELWSGERRRTSAQNWRGPRKWNRAAADAGRRVRVFCCSLADVFDNKVPTIWRQDLWELIRETPSLDWQLLTKRPQNIAKMLPADWGDGYRNVWLGTTVENQDEADRRIPHLLALPAAVRFLSCEPLLGPVDLRDLRLGIGQRRDALTGAGAREVHWTGGLGNAQEGLQALASVPLVQKAGSIDWVIVGGESGHGARPMKPAWAASIIEQCRAAFVPVWFKQTGSNLGPWPIGLTGKGDDPEQWPPEVNVQEMPI